MCSANRCSRVVRRALNPRRKVHPSLTNGEFSSTSTSSPGLRALHRLSYSCSRSCPRSSHAAAAPSAKVEKLQAGHQLWSNCVERRKRRGEDGTPAAGEGLETAGEAVEGKTGKQAARRRKERGRNRPRRETISFDRLPLGGVGVLFSPSAPILLCCTASTTTSSDPTDVATTRTLCVKS